MSDLIDVNGTITELLPNAMFTVQLDDGRTVKAAISGKLRMNYIRLACGDRVVVTLSPDGSSMPRVTDRSR